MTALPCRQNYSGLRVRANAHVRQLYYCTTMPTYLYFGENEFFLSRAIKQLKTHTLLGVCSKEILLQLESILPKILSTNTLLITNTHKPDARNKSVKLLLEYAQVYEFPLIPQWQTQALIQASSYFS